jgi:hypothetical protein
MSTSVTQPRTRLPTHFLQWSPSPSQPVQLRTDRWINPRGDIRTPSVLSVATHTRATGRPFYIQTPHRAKCGDSRL